MAETFQLRININRSLTDCAPKAPPSSDRVAVQTTRSSICKVELFNPVGSLVYSTSGLEVGAVIIDVNTYAKGLYSVRVYLKDGTVEVRKIIVE